MDSDGKRLKQLTRSEALESTPRWSPDGSKILFRSKVDEKSEADLYTIGIDGTGLKQLTATPVGEFHQSWSPDGGHICFVKVVDGAFEIHLISKEGGESSLLVRKKGYQAFFPNWSPDGTRIAFTRDTMDGAIEGFPALYTVDLKGQEKNDYSKKQFLIHLNQIKKRTVMNLPFKLS